MHIYIPVGDINAVGGAVVAFRAAVGGVHIG